MRAKMNKKLVLNKETVRALTDSEMLLVAGGRRDGITPEQDRIGQNQIDQRRVTQTAICCPSSITNGHVELH